ncbi:TlpA family protein disulfide reductase [Winogradskyella sp.]|uniref:TlpA family protein disulfide reductase n=1 Tax=Winogradskyella sp. TaxID=1883156 RepID=UPI003AB355EF
MKKQILNLGKALSKAEEKVINGGNLGSRSRGLLLISLSLLLLSFNYNIENVPQFEAIDKYSKISDSLVLSIVFKGKGRTGLNVSNNLLENYSLDLTNNTNDTIQIIKRIPRVYKAMTLKYMVTFFNKGKQRVSVNQCFVVDENVDTLKLTFNAKTSLFNKNNFTFDSLYKSYSEISTKIFQQKKTHENSLKKELDTLYNSYKEKYINSQDKTLFKLNEIHYFDKLQMLYPNSNAIDNFLKRLKDPIASSALASLLYIYVKNKITSFDYNKLNTAYYNEAYLELIARGHFLFLSYEDNKTKPNYQPSVDWLKATAFYKKNKVIIDKKIIPLNNNVFKDKLKNLELLDTTFKVNGFAEIIKQHPSNYYLIDFWATWCAPCIDGIKRMQTMNIPGNLKIISLSVDKIEIKEKWRIKTKEFKQSISYLIDDSVKGNQSFLKFIELHSIPRYILIDKNMNLIDQAFYHPSDLQFLLKLKDVKNAKFW